MTGIAVIVSPAAGLYGFCLFNADRFRYHHHESNLANPLPGLLDSVRWKAERVASVLQRTYQASESAANWQTAADEATFKFILC